MNVWFDNVPIGKNKLDNMMKDISQQAGTVHSYTNHHVRATVVTTLAAKACLTAQSWLSLVDEIEVLQSLDELPEPSEVVPFDINNILDSCSAEDLQSLEKPLPA